MSHLLVYVALFALMAIILFDPIYGLAF